MTNMSKKCGLSALALGAALSLGAVPMAYAQERVSTVVNTMQIFSSLDPAKVTDYTGYMAVVNMYDGLTTVAPSGEVVPHLAKAWDISEDGLTYTFHLRDDVTFQDGSPLSASDAVWSIQRLLKINKGPSNLLVDLIDPANVVAPDSATVKITLNRPFSPFLASTPILLVLNQTLIEANATEEDPFGEIFVGDNSAGSGPYALVSYNRSADMVIARNVDYFLGWDKGTPVDEVRFVQTSDDATVRALAENGQLGLSSHGLGNDTFDAIGNMPGYKLLQTRTAGGFQIKLNTQTYPTDDVHVRRAIAYATDYQTIQEIIYPGVPMYGPLSDTFETAFNDQIPAGEYNLEKAQEELAKSKYAGQDITLVNSYVASLAFEQEVALLMQANLAQIGITLDIRPEPWNRIVELASNPETTPASTQVNASPSYPSPDAMFFNQYHSKATGTWWSMEWLENAEIDALIDQSRAQTDPAEINATYKELQQKIYDLQPAVWAVAPMRRYAANACLQGYEFRPMQSWDLNFWHLTWDCAAG